MAAPIQLDTGNCKELGTFLYRKGDRLDRGHFPPVLKQYPIHSGGFYRIHGKVVEEFGVYAVEVRALGKVGVRKNQ
ncbi:hypothetical protein [Echinicola sp. 20G]|uniref:hypothetical protein n=1 Tax=Echinicola sp. 20G TaxID=2781961 RepID=UPI0019106980|nr:hypothetical protein [Echinicola sp. 20G]